MATVFCTLKVMPDSTDVNLKDIEEAAKEKIVNFGGEIATVEVQPIAFGLNALMISFFVDEKKGSPDPVADEIAEMDGVASATIVDVRRTIG